MGARQPRVRDGKRRICSANGQEVAASLSRMEREKPLLLGDGMERTLDSYLDPWEYKSNVFRVRVSHVSGLKTQFCSTCVIFFVCVIVLMVLLLWRQAACVHMKLPA